MLIDHVKPISMLVTDVRQSLEAEMRLACQVVLRSLLSKPRIAGPGVFDRHHGRPLVNCCRLSNPLYLEQRVLQLTGRLMAACNAL